MEKLDKVIAGLTECSRGGERNCYECVYWDYYDYACVQALRREALDVIEALRAERDDLRKDNRVLNRIHEDWGLEMARLFDKISEARIQGAQLAPVAASCEKPGTNFERIHNMSPMALADWICRMEVCRCCDRKFNCGMPMEEVTDDYCTEHILMWLAQEVENE